MEIEDLSILRKRHAILYFIKPMVLDTLRRRRRVTDAHGAEAIAGK